MELLEQVVGRNRPVTRLFCDAGVAASVLVILHVTNCQLSQAFLSQSCVRFRCWPDPPLKAFHSLKLYDRGKVYI